MHVIGTSGHVDHGKSTLVKALSGIDPDRLREEKQRQMTIDLGFAWFTLPSGQEVGIVDVPGHRDFIENMLAGMPGVDLALLVVAMDEGVMPQTREHLAVLDLLQVKTGIIALTKSDIVHDNEWVEMVKLDVNKLILGTILEEAPILAVSAKTGTGIKELIHLIDAQLNKIPARRDISKPRLAVDRVFSLSGFGTIVTGTLLDGQLRVGDEIELLPFGLRARIRGLQTHKQKEEVALPGNRTAVNLTGLQVGQLHRGDVLVHPDTYQPITSMEVSFRMLPDANRALRNQEQVKLFIGSAAVNAHVRLLSGNEILPGAQGFLQLILSSPTLAIRGDHYILRRPSPPQTIGGGDVLDTHSEYHRRRISERELERLLSLKAEGVETDLLQILHKEGIRTLNQLKSLLKEEENEIKALVVKLTEENRIIVLNSGERDILPDDLLIEVSKMEELVEKIRLILNTYYRAHPLRIGMKQEELKSHMALPEKEFEAIISYLNEQGVYNVQNGLVSLPSRIIQFLPRQEQSIRQLLTLFTESPSEPPAVDECINSVGKDVYQSLLDQQILIQISAQIVFTIENYTRMENEIITAIKQRGKISLAEVRDLLQTSRKYALAILEHLDRKGVTIREGDFRKLKKG